MNKFYRYIRIFLRFFIFGISAETWFLWARRLEQKSPESFLARYIQHLIQRKFACYLSSKAVVCGGLILKHPVNIVIGEGVKIGLGVTIYQGVTLGAKKMGEEVRGYPIIGDGVVIYAGACVIGGVNVGERVVIGAGAVVTKDVPAGAVVVGAPSRFIL